MFSLSFKPEKSFFWILNFFIQFHVKNVFKLGYKLFKKNPNKSVSLLDKIQK